MIGEHESVLDDDRLIEFDYYQKRRADGNVEIAIHPNRAGRLVKLLPAKLRVVSILRSIGVLMILPIGIVVHTLCMNLPFGWLVGPIWFFSVFPMFCSINRDCKARELAKFANNDSNLFDALIRKNEIIFKFRGGEEQFQQAMLRKGKLTKKEKNQRIVNRLQWALAIGLVIFCIWFASVLRVAEPTSATLIASKFEEPAPDKGATTEPLFLLQNRSASVEAESNRSQWVRAYFGSVSAMFPPGLAKNALNIPADFGVNVNPESMMTDYNEGKFGFVYAKYPERLSTLEGGIDGMLRNIRTDPNVSKFIHISKDGGVIGVSSRLVRATFEYSEAPMVLESLIIVKNHELWLVFGLGPVPTTSETFEEIFKSIKWLE